MKSNNQTHQKISRVGVYGVCVEEGKVLLVKKHGGPFVGLWDLPGGGIEFGESPEAALRREFQEEVAMGFETMKLLDNFSLIASHVHFLGMIYKVLGVKKLEQCVAQDQFSWFLLTSLKPEELTPFAKQMLFDKMATSWVRRG